MQRGDKGAAPCFCINSINQLGFLPVASNAVCVQQAAATSCAEAPQPDPRQKACKALVKLRGAANCRRRLSAY